MHNQMTGDFSHLFSMTLSAAINRPYVPREVRCPGADVYVIITN